MPDPSPRPRVFTIAPSRPFLPTLVAALMDGRLVPGFGRDSGPLALADATILVPTRRAARALREVFLEALGGRAAILPVIKPLGDLDEDSLVIDRAAFARDLTPEMDGVARLLGLSRLVAAWSSKVAGLLVNPVTEASPTLPASPAEAVHLARALLALLDQVETEAADWSRLSSIVPEDHAGFWALTLRFLEIVSETWPAVLAERGLVDPAKRRNRLIREEARRLAEHPPAGPMIVAGSTGSIPATADLIRAIARLPQGAVVLPGLDRDLDAESWAAIGAPDDPERRPVPGHPQYGLKLLLARLGIDRDGVDDLDPEPSAALRLRARAVSEALKPAGTTETWKDFAREVRPTGGLGAAFEGVSLVEARSDSEEALAIAVALREALADEGRTAALVTPDRDLARRVSAELGRWGLAVDDSAGVPLLSTPPTVLARLVAETATGGFAPVTLVALLQHPLAAFGLPRAAARGAARALELACLRGPRPRSGSAGLREAFDQARHDAGARVRSQPAARLNLQQADWAAAEDLLDRLTDALGGLEALALAPGLNPLADFAGAHAEAVRAAAADEEGSDARLFEGEAGEALASALAGLVAACRDTENRMEIGGRDYPPVFEALIGPQPVRRRAGADARLAIWGPLEARLQSVDRLILAGLDEGTWPASARSDPWLSRPMKGDLGLEPPERRIGLAAHDFAQGIGAREVILARAVRSGGAPTVPSRWLQRLTAVVDRATLSAMRARGERLLGLARDLDRPAVTRPRPVARPAPVPPLEARPDRLSVTEIETWIRDPYAIYARRILKLEPIEALAAAPDAGDRGSIVHAILERFVEGWRPEPAETALERFLSFAEDALAPHSAFPEVVALWRPRLARIGRWFHAFELGRHPDVAARILESRQAMELALPGGPFTLTGRADRIDVMSDGSVAVLDYKTGTLPSTRQVKVLLAPQLPLEAAMVRAGAFGADLAGRTVSDLLYVKLSGSGEGGEARLAAGKPARGEVPPTPDELAEAALAKLIGLVALYRRPGQGYPSRPRIQFSRRIDGPYDHLARVKEWAAGQGGEE
ncbi:double-strand break repair protein AddB [Prosthecomicrobium sp. N25]|uniref:double-strand break repair protein AddB n=1 Tax=Prosthecomicrobium sp. N25 TaxID=3129254 RepID=UPI0030769F16